MKKLRIKDLLNPTNELEPILRPPTWLQDGPWARRNSSIPHLPPSLSSSPKVALRRQSDGVCMASVQERENDFDLSVSVKPNGSMFWSNNIQSEDPAEATSSKKFQVAGDGLFGYQPVEAEVKEVGVGYTSESNLNKGPDTQGEGVKPGEEKREDGKKGEVSRSGDESSDSDTSNPSNDEDGSSGDETDVGSSYNPGPDEEGDEGNSTTGDTAAGSKRRLPRRSAKARSIRETASNLAIERELSSDGSESVGSEYDGNRSVGSLSDGEGSVTDSSASSDDHAVVVDTVSTGTRRRRGRPRKASEPPMVSVEPPRKRRKANLEVQSQPDLPSSSRKSERLRKPSERLRAGLRPGSKNPEVGK